MVFIIKIKAYMPLIKVKTYLNSNILPQFKMYNVYALYILYLSKSNYSKYTIGK